MGARINTADVSAEIERLRVSWGLGLGGSFPGGTAANHPPEAAGELPDGLNKILEGLDEFDRVQLAGVIRVCREYGSLAEAGRRLYAKSRLRKQGGQNDTDRLKKYLAKFSLSWDQVKSGVPFT
jgi:transcriptional regulatory protein RtcR